MTTNLHLLLPEFILAGLAILILVIDLMLPRRYTSLLPWTSVAGLAALLTVTLMLLWGKEESLYGGLVRADAYSLFFKSFFIVLGGIIILSSADYVKRYLRSPGEYYSIVLFAILAMILLSSAVELLTAYIALELMSFSFYVLVAYARDNPKSNEAGVKYILIGAFSSAILLYGISLLYGALGETTFAGIGLAMENKLLIADSFTPTLWIGLALILAGLGFKIAAVPFHMWAPDTYEGAPLPVTAFLSVGSKVAAFALMIRLFTQSFDSSIDQWQILIATLAAITMTVGNLAAIAQTNYKRLLAYSSIAHVGYMLVGIAALSVMSVEALMLYLVGYAVTSMAVFVALIAFFNMSGRENLDDLGGLGDNHPFIAAAIAISLFSLAGLPFFAGFTTKFYLFTAAATEGLLWLSGLAILNSLISLYYYLKVVKQMYIEPTPSWPEGGYISDPIRNVPSPLISVILALLVIGVIAVGIYPSPLLEAIRASADALMSTS